jgi:ABC-2 type transport system permease protein
MSIFKKLRERYRYSITLLNRLVIVDFKLRYQGSVLGYLWSLLKPLMLFTILYIVFVHFLKFGADQPHFAVSLLLGVVLWNYFVEVTMGGVASIVSHGDLLRKLNFPRYVIVVAGSFSALINLLLNLLVVVFFMIINGVEFRAINLFVVLPLAELFIFALSLAFLLSALYVKYRDINYIWEVVLQAGFYATPILYPISMVLSTSPLAAKLLLLNPVAQIIQDARVLLIDPTTPTVGDVYQNPYMRLVPVFAVLLFMIFAAYYFRARSPYFAEEV